MDVFTASAQQIPCARCTWSQTDWSCVYDSSIMAMFFAYKNLPTTHKDQLKTQIDLMHQWSDQFEHRISSELVMSHTKLN